MKTLQDTLLTGEAILSENHIEEAKIDAWYLLEYFFHKTRVEYLMNPSATVSEDNYNCYIEAIYARAKNIPLQHIIGIQEFMGLNFIVSEDVLVPRQDTECLVEEVMKVANHKSILDMCTGSGCIIISLAKLCHLEEAIGVDISKRALNIAQRNVKKHAVNVELIESNLFDKIERRFDIIVSNPPYIKTDVIKSLMPEVKDHEPMLALDGKEDGLFFYKDIIKNASKYLEQNGMIFFEIGYDQGLAVKELLEINNFYNVTIIKDLAGLDRVVFGHIGNVEKR